MYIYQHFELLCRIETDYILGKFNTDRDRCPIADQT